MIAFLFVPSARMGHSLYELDLELFEDVDSQVGNSFVTDKDVSMKYAELMTSQLHLGAVITE